VGGLDQRPDRVRRGLAAGGGRDQPDDLAV
jgi:hypothetical protein